MEMSDLSAGLQVCRLRRRTSQRAETELAAMRSRGERARSVSICPLVQSIEFLTPACAARADAKLQHPVLGD
eukprot:6185615-Pleurochrysis_carterae.AAC.4